MTDNRSRPLWLLSVLFAAAVIGLTVWFLRVIPPQLCSGPPPAGVSSLLVYQLSRTPADIEQVFGAAGDPCRAPMIASMDRVNIVDLVAFIPTYGAFLACFFLALRRQGAGAPARIGLLAVVAALAFDVLETSVQLRITAHLPGSAASLRLLAIGSIGKYLALAIASVFGGLALIARRSLLGRIAGTVCAVGGVLAVVGLAVASARAALTPGSALAWLAMLVYAAAASAGRE